jgi:hypothetical protein
MSAAARPKSGWVSRQAKGREFDPTRVESFTLLTWRGVLLRVPGVTWKGKRKSEMISIKWMGIGPKQDDKIDLPFRSSSKALRDQSCQAQLAGKWHGRLQE